MPNALRTLPVRQLLLLLGAIFSTFATIGFQLDILAGGRFPLHCRRSLAGRFAKSPIICWPARGITVRSSMTRRFC